MSKTNKKMLVLALCMLLVLCLGLVAACDKSGDGATLERIEIEKQPNKTAYYVGDKFSRTGMKVKAYYSDGTSKNVMKYEITPSEALTLDDKEITVTFEGKTAKVAITVTERPIDTQLTVTSAETYTYKVEAETLPMGNEQEPTSNEQYIENHSETTGNPATSGGKSLGGLNNSNEIVRMKIKSDVEANINIVMSLAWVEPYGSNALDFDKNVDTYWNNNQITTGLSIGRDDPATYVWYDWHEYTIANLKLTKGYNDFVLRIKGNFPNMDYIKVVVNPFDESKVTGIEVTKAPTKTNYFEGETFNADDKMEVSVVLEDGSKIPVNDYKTDKNILSVDDTAVNISYLNFNTGVNVVVTKAEIVSLKVANQPDKIEYYPGQQFDRTGLVLIAETADGTELNVTSFAEYQPEFFEQSGVATVTATYGDKTASISVTVAEVKAHVEIKDDGSKTYRVEAEDALFVKGNGDKEKYSVVDDANASGGKRLDSCDWLKGSSFIVVVNSEVEGKVVPFVCCDGGGAVEGLEAITVMTWNGEEIILRKNLDHGWGNFQSVGTGKLDRSERYKVFDLKKGTNVFIIRLTADNSVNYDYFEFSVNPVDEIAVTKQPDKTTYNVGDAFDTTGMEVTATYEITRAKGATVEEYGKDRPTKVVAGYTVSPATLSVDTKEVVISYGGRTTTVAVNVVSDAELTSISVDASSVNKTYYAGQKFDTTGLVVTAHYSDGTSAQIENYTIQNDVIGLDTKEIVVEFEGKTATIDGIEAKAHMTIENDDTATYRIECEDALWIAADGKKYTVVSQDGTSGGKRLGGFDNLAGCKFYVAINSKVAARVVPVACVDGGGALGSFELAATMTFNGEEIILRTGLENGWENFQAIWTGKADRSQRNAVLELKQGLNVFEVTLSGNVNFDYFEFVVNPIDEIVVTKQPAKTEYKEGETFDPAGMELTIYYDITRAKGVEHAENRPTKVVTEGFTFSPEKIDINTDKITVTYLGKTTEVAVTVVLDKTLQSISLDASSVNKTYYVGQKFDTTGLVVTAHYSDGSTAAVDKYTTDCDNVALNTTKVTVTYGDKTAEIDGIVVKTHLTIEADTEKVRIEAEDALWTKGSGDKEKYSVVDDTDASGGKRLDSCDWLNGSTFTVTINAKKACKIKIIVATDGPGSKLQEVGTAQWNGNGLTFDVTSSGGWGSFAPYEIAEVELSEGANVFVWTLTGNINYDYFEFQVVTEVA